MKSRGHTYMSTEKRNKIKDYQKLSRMLLLAFYDGLAVLLSAFLALYIRFDMSFAAISHEYLDAAFSIVPLTILLTWVVFKFMHLYDSLWAYASVRELCLTVMAGAIVVLSQVVVINLIDPYYVPRSYHFIFGFFYLIFVASVRFSYRAVRILRHTIGLKNHDGMKRIMLIGGGHAGRLIIDEVNRSEEMNARVCCVIDDDRAKKGKYLRGVEIIGGRECIVDAVEKYNINQIIVAMPSVSRREQKEILNICKDTGCEMKIVPGIYQMLNGDVSISKLRNVEIEDLLGRDPIKVNSDDIFQYITGKIILVTGGGGSIGSELCRQIAAHNPKTLIIFDVYENNAYDIQLELKKKYPQMDLRTIIGSVRDSRKIFQVFEQFHPDIVYHAAAHKHVPLMEDSPCEYRLLKLALTSGEQYQYLHLLTGASFPIKSNQFIFDFFNENDGKQFIGFDNNSDYTSRAKYRFLFNELGKPKSQFDYRLLSIRKLYIQLQKKLGINRFTKFNMQFKKGLAYWSITESCAKYILEKEKIVKKMLRYSLYGDEVFVQTLVYNSPFRDSIYDLTDEYEGCLVAVAWKKFVGEDRIGHNFLMKDFNILEESDLLYALKFEGQEGVDLIHQIENKLL